MNSSSSIKELKGIGEKTAQLFQKLGIETVGDLLGWYPRDYDRMEPPVSVMEARERDFCAIRGLSLIHI